MGAVVSERAVGVLRLGTAVAPELARDARGIDVEPFRHPGEAPALDGPVLDFLAHLKGEVDVVPCCRHGLTAFPGGVQSRDQQLGAQSVPRCGSLDVKATSRGRPPVSRTYNRPTAGFPAPALAINDSRQKMEGDTLI